MASPTCLSSLHILEAHKPHISTILSTIYAVTHKSSTTGRALQQVLQLAQKSNHQALPIVPSGSFFQVEALTTMYYSAWSLRTKCFPWLPLGFETTWLPFIVTYYTPLKHQILAVYWVLFQRQLNRNRSCSLYTVLLCTQIPITSCLRSATQ